MKIDILSVDELHFKYTGEVSDFNGLDTALLTAEIHVSFNVKYDNKPPELYGVIVPISFETDFGSVPKIFHWLVKPRGTSDRAYVVHDWLCITKTIDQLIVDELFLTMMRLDKTSYIESLLAYTGVRLYDICVRPFYNPEPKILPNNVVMFNLLGIGKNEHYRIK
jgi:hypothetical protein